MSMSTMVVTDLAGVSATGTAVLPEFNSGGAKESTITPFKTILEQTTGAKKQSEAKAVSSASVQKAAQGGGAEGGTTGTTKLENIFRRASEKYDISYDFLVAVAKAESDFNYNCVSSAGAKGIMQLMPDEVKEFGVKDVFNPEENIMAAAKLLAAHLKKFKGDFTLAAAAYNAGSGAVKKYGGVPPYTETQNYVKKIAKFMKEGVTVPDKDAKVSGNYSDNTGHSDSSSSAVSSSDGSSDTASGDSSGAVSSNDGASAFDEGVSATDADWDKVRITVGSGDDAVTMTYGAYLKYKELGSLGVG